MSGWEKHHVEVLTLYRATDIARLSGVVQGFTTRAGGVSAAPYHSLNLGTRVGDDPMAVQANRARVWSALGFSPSQVALAEQVHGCHVAQVTSGGMTPGADALITDRPGVLLMLLHADCVPVYVVDPLRRSLGLAHAGWRGAAGGVVGRTVAALRDTYGGAPADFLAAVGPCIGPAHYEVGLEVAERFRALGGGVVTPKDGAAGKYLLDLRRAVFAQLVAAGLRPECIAVSGADTFADGQDFFSHRRDGAATGRMAAVLGLSEPGSEGIK